MQLPPCSCSCLASRWRSCMFSSTSLSLALSFSAIAATSLSFSSAALIFSEYFSAPTFLTSNGSFELIVGTSITEKELDLVRASSVAHLLLLLRNFGVGQLSDPLRSCVSQDPSFDEVRQQIQSREIGDVLSALRSEAVISRIRRATRCRFGCF